VTARSRLELIHRIQRRYAMSSGEIHLKNLNLPFTRIAEPDRVLDDAVAEEDRRQRSLRELPAPHVPYWAELWESALGVAQVISRSICGGASVLDLGCGMGLAGTAAAAAGASVLMADLEPFALLLARLNSWTWRKKVRARRVNWQTDRLGERFDLILGADILYEQSQWEFLNSFWLAHLAHGGVVLLGEPGRATGDRFIEWIAQHGWQIEQSAEPVTASNRQVRIFRLQTK
jgi:predicted nicotinamide N-methyase